MKPTPNTPQLIDAREAASLLGIHLSTLYTWCEEERVPFVRLGRALRFDPTDLQRWIDDHRVPPRQGSAAATGERSR